MNINCDSCYAFGEKAFLWTAAAAYLTAKASAITLVAVGILRACAFSTVCGIALAPLMQYSLIAFVGSGALLALISPIIFLTNFHPPAC